jgi:hypothetical protein
LRPAAASALFGLFDILRILKLFFTFFSRDGEYKAGKPLNSGVFFGMLNCMRYLDAAVCPGVGASAHF